MNQIIEVRNGKIRINNKNVDFPKPLTHASITQIGSRVYVNGFEWINGKWRRTLPAIWHYLF